MTSLMCAACKTLHVLNASQGDDTTGKAELALMEDVHDAILDVLELTKTYQSKNRLSQLLTSSLFRRRQDEMGAVVDRAILSLQVSPVNFLTYYCPEKTCGVQT